jgi:hypothetical protein
MMERKGKVPTEEQVEKLVKKIPTSKAKEAQRMMQWVKEPIWGDFLTSSGLHHKKTCKKIFVDLGGDKRWYIKAQVCS